MPTLSDDESGQLIGAVTQSDLQSLVDSLEFESSGDSAFYVDPQTLDMLEASGASGTLVGLLRSALAGREGMEVRVNGPMPSRKAPAPNQAWESLPDPPTEPLTELPVPPSGPVFRCEVFSGEMPEREQLFDQAAAFATAIGRDRLVSITQSATEDECVVAVWYWSENELSAG